MVTAKGGDDGSNGKGKRVTMWEVVTAREGTKRKKRQSEEEFLCDSFGSVEAIDRLIVDHCFKTAPELLMQD
jgi:hypothetical protein